MRSKLPLIALLRLGILSGISTILISVYQFGTHQPSDVAQLAIDNVDMSIEMQEHRADILSNSSPIYNISEGLVVRMNRRIHNMDTDHTTAIFRSETSQPGEPDKVNIRPSRQAVVPVTCDSRKNKSELLLMVSFKMSNWSPVVVFSAKCFTRQDAELECHLLRW